MKRLMLIGVLALATSAAVSTRAAEVALIPMPQEMSLAADGADRAEDREDCAAGEKRRQRRVPRHAGGVAELVVVEDRREHLQRHRRQHDKQRKRRRRHLKRGRQRYGDVGLQAPDQK